MSRLKIFPIKQTPPIPALVLNNRMIRTYMYICMLGLTKWIFTVKLGEVVRIILLEVLWIKSHQLHPYLCLYFEQLNRLLERCLLSAYTAHMCAVRSPIWLKFARIYCQDFTYYLVGYESLLSIVELYEHTVIETYCGHI